MRKTITNADILTMYNTLNEMKSRSDLIPGDAEIFWANAMNLKVLKEKSDNISEIVQELINTHFTEENSHSVVDENGNDTGKRVLNDDVKDTVISEINTDIEKIYAKTCEVELESIPKESLKKMVKANEDKMSFLEMTVMNEFVGKDNE